jgi:hypothetical protein
MPCFRLSIETTRRKQATLRKRQHTRSAKILSQAVGNIFRSIGINTNFVVEAISTTGKKKEDPKDEK